MRTRHLAFLGMLSSLSIFTACSATNPPAPFMSSNATAVSSPVREYTGGGKIQHIVIMIQENRSFDNFFATFPGANGTTTGYYLKKVNGKYVRTQVTLGETTLAGLDLNHSWADYTMDYDKGGMDGFGQERINGNNPAPHMYAYEYVEPSQIQPYWTLAQEYALADNMFQTQGSGSFTAHQDLIAGTTHQVYNNHIGSLIDYPSLNGNWGCNAKAGTVTSMLTKSGQYLKGGGPFPCLTYSTGTMRDLLDAKQVSWKYYAPPHQNNKVGALWNAFAAIDAVYNGPEWATNISMPETNIFNDISNAQLPAVSWVIPDQVDSDHAHSKTGEYNGPEWIASVVNAIGQSSYWNSTAIIVVWDDWGGWYDHVPPPFFDNAGGLGFRVPMLVISPYVPAGTIAHTQYEFGSILKFVEETFHLGSMGTTDVRAKSIGNIFNFKMKARTFHVIQAARSRAYFMHQPPSYAPVDTE
ncbi:MAG: alkaline phosphatase family protein [Candidatus Tumulicola sp.]